MSQPEQTQTATHLPAPIREENPFWEIARFATIALLIVLPIRALVAQPFIVSGASMEDTFHNNEYLIVDQLTYRFEAPERGDVIIFRYPKDLSKYFIKRIIALPGETIRIKGDQVTIYNAEHPEGQMLDEPYRAAMSQSNEEERTLGAGEYFVMGDNRDHSSDSRMWGVVKEDEIIGRAWLRLFPPSRLSFLPGRANAHWSQ